MGTKNNPGAYDCYANAEPDEPMFVLLARDPHAAEAVEKWATDRELYIVCGLKPASDHALVAEARGAVAAMRAWRAKHRPDDPLHIPAETNNFDAWAQSAEGWEIDTGGAPGIWRVANAIQTLTILRNRPFSVGEVAVIFNLAPSRVIEAVEEHNYMFLAGPRDDLSTLMIEHDGE